VSDTLTKDIDNSPIALLDNPFIMRLAYATSTADDQTPEVQDIYARITARRLPRPLIPLDLTLLHAPPVADGYNSFVGALRTKTIVDAGLLELSISRVAVLNHAVYEWNIHAPLALKAGIQPAELEEAQKLPSYTELSNNEDGRNAWQETCLNARQRVVVAYTDEMTRNVVVKDETFKLLNDVEFSDREILELTTTIAGYNCVSRILVSLDVGENNGKEMKSVESMAN
jgi:alkylhydroperoxidase family enzyme